MGGAQRCGRRPTPPTVCQVVANEFGIDVDKVTTLLCCVQRCYLEEERVSQGFAVERIPKEPSHGRGLGDVPSSRRAREGVDLHPVLTNLLQVSRMAAPAEPEVHAAQTAPTTKQAVPRMFKTKVRIWPMDGEIDGDGGRIPGKTLPPQRSSRRLASSDSVAGRDSTLTSHVAVPCTIRTPTTQMIPGKPRPRLQWSYVFVQQPF